MRLLYDEPVIRYAAVLFVCACAAGAVPASVDGDRDGLPDDFEQAMLMRFVPRLQISADECDEAPALFQPGSNSPKVMRQDGTLYGQVMKSSVGGDGLALELHYYHLWRRDCGRRGHPLDAEHVSVLVRARQMEDPAELWKAVYWYASAHQDTLCDVSHAVRAASIGAEEAGAAVWISAGKHASFLTEEQCRKSCGADQCDAGRALVPAAVINIGERDSLMNGAVWTESKRWAMAVKMNPDFNDVVVARVEEGTGVIPTNGSRRPVRAVIAAGGSSVGAVENATSATEGGLSKSKSSSGNALKKAHKKVKGWLGVGE